MTRIKLKNAIYLKNSLSDQTDCYFGNQMGRILPLIYRAPAEQGVPNIDRKFLDWERYNNIESFRRQPHPINFFIY